MGPLRRPFLEKHVRGGMRAARKRVEQMELDYQPILLEAQITPQQQYSQACANDNITVETWRNIWISQAKENKEILGSFEKHSIGQLFGSNEHKPCILAGSGPSLAYNGELLKERGDLKLVSCLHNFHYFEDRDIPVDYYVTLDAGQIVLEEISEGGRKSPEEYWEKTKDRTLVAYMCSYPELFRKWKGKLYVFACPVPDKKYEEEMEKLEPFYAHLSSGGNVLGACLYFSKAILGSWTSAFVGADFSFSYNNKFHGWESKYDGQLGRYIRATDVFGNSVKTWQSYANFCTWFNYIAGRVPGVYFNCTEGGIFGAYPNGNIIDVKQMRLQEFLNMAHMHNELKDQYLDTTKNQKKILF